MTTTVSYLAILRDGRHLSGSATYQLAPLQSFDRLREMIIRDVRPHRADVETLYYATGHEHQRYSGRETREVFFGDEP